MVDHSVAGGLLLNRFASGKAQAAYQLGAMLLLYAARAQRLAALELLALP